MLPNVQTNPESTFGDPTSVEYNTYDVPFNVNSGYRNGAVSLQVVQIRESEKLLNPDTSPNPIGPNPERGLDEVHGVNTVIHETS